MGQLFCFVCFCSFSSLSGRRTLHSWTLRYIKYALKSNCTLLTFFSAKNNILIAIKSFLRRASIAFWNLFWTPVWHCSVTTTTFIFLQCVCLTLSVPDSEKNSYLNCSCPACVTLHIASYVNSIRSLLKATYNLLIIRCELLFGKTDN